MIALVVAPYSDIRESLTSLISVIPQIDVVSTTNNLDRGIDFVQEHHPAIVVLVLDEIDSIKLGKIKNMKESCQDIKIVAFLKNSNENLESTSTPEVDSGIFDAAIPQYTRAGTIRKKISDLISTTEQT